MHLAFCLIFSVALTHAFPSSQGTSEIDDSLLYSNGDFVPASIEESFEIESFVDTELLAADPTGCLSGIDKRDYDSESEFIGTPDQVLTI